MNESIVLIGQQIIIRKKGGGRIGSGQSRGS